MLIFWSEFTNPTAPLKATIGGTFAFTRNSVAWYPDDSGVYVQKTAHQPGVNHNGIFLEPPSTNLCKNYNASPDAGLTNVSVTGAASIARVDRSVVLTEAGLGNICPQQAFRYTNTTGAAQTITVIGEAGSTNPASVQAWCKVTGDDPVTMQLTGGQGAVPLYETTKFQRFISENISHSAATDQFQFVVPDGTTLEWVLNQLEVSTGANYPAACTSPIVTAGNIASRVGTVLSIAVPANFPVNNITITLNATPSSRWQQYNNPRILHIYKDANNAILVYGYGSVSATKKTSGTSYSSAGTYSFDKGASRLGFRLSGFDGVTSFVNTEKGQTVSSNTADINVAGGTIFIGCVNYGDNYYNGQIKDFKIYSSALSDEELKLLLRRFPERSVKSLGKGGLPLYEKNSTRIWALSWSEALSSFDGIKYSDDYGTTWTQWTTWGSAYTSTFPLAMDLAGNFYFMPTGGAQLLRVDRITKQITSVINFNALPGNPSWSWSWLPWHWAIDSAGTIYTTAYQTANTGGQYIWKSADSGLNWTRIDQFVSNFAACKHIHSMHCNPFNNKLYVTIGDDPSTRGTFVSSDGLITDAIRITESTNPGPTGLTFTNEAVWLSTDIQGNSNYIKSCTDDLTAKNNFTAPVGYHLAPIYDVVAVGDNELWACMFDDSSTANIKGGVFRLSKKRGVFSPWEYKIISDGHEPELDGTAFYSISRDYSGIIPEDSPYVFVYLLKYNANSGPAAQVFRIKRTLEELGEQGNQYITTSPAATSTGQVKLNIKPESHPDDTTIIADHTYSLADANAWRVVTGWTAGTANDFFDADGLPISFTGQQLIDFGIGPRLYCGLRGIAGYTVDQDAPTNAKIIKILKVSTYIDTLYWADSAEMDWSASNE